MKFNDAYRTVFEKRKNILLKSPPPPTIHSKKKFAWNFNVFISCPKLKQNKQ